MITTRDDTGVADPVFDFDHPHERPARELVDLLGGKGAGLAAMTSALGLPVPPGFTVSLPLCRAYRESGWPDGLDELIERHLRSLEDRIGRQFGDPADPLLLAVRSGAPRSMPGMLDTVLNLGMNPETVEGLAVVSGDPAFAWESYRRFLAMYATTVLDAPAELVGGHQRAAERADARALRADVDAVRRSLNDAGYVVPDDPSVQLRAAVEAVFRSWDSPRARTYRTREGIHSDIGTAVNVRPWGSGTSTTRPGPEWCSRAIPPPAKPRPTATSCRGCRAKTSSPGPHTRWKSRP